MKLLLNTTLLNPPLTGIGNYTLNLLSQFQRLSDFKDIICFNENEMLSSEQALFENKNKQAKPIKASLIRRVISRVPYAYQAKNLYLNYQLFRRQIGLEDYIYHEPNFILQKHKGPAVVTIHDLSFFHYPEYHPTARMQWFQANIVETLKVAKHILTVSHLVREDLIENFNVNPDKVHTTYLAAGAQFQQRCSVQTQSVLNLYGLTHGQYLLFVGTIEPRKGLIDLLDAWEQLPAEIRKLYPLVLVGGAGWQNTEIMIRVQKLMIAGELKYLDYISNESLPILYSGCLSFVFPSVYEGFGLPVLEAMASGVPVICREKTSMAEFAQDAVILHESSTESLAHQLSQVIENKALRNEYAIKGLERATQFSWHKCAQKTINVYKQC